MKTILKIAALAAITALAVISCGPPDLPQAHNGYWDQYNDQFDATKYTITTLGNIPTVSDYTLNAYADTWTDGKEDNTVTITFPDKADVLKKDALTTADLNFISFYTYNANSAKAAADAATTAAPNTAATSLNALPGWSFDRRNGNDIIVKLPALTVASSNIVYKLDGSLYTYSNGLKIDKDGNGITGEKGYDDDFIPLPVTGITISTPPVLPENKGWVVTLKDLSLAFPAGSTDTTTAADLELADTTFSSGEITVADFESILNKLAAGFKVESFSVSSGNWSNSASGSLDDTTTTSRIIAKGFQASHNKAYRVVFEKGSISLETDKEFYGLKQRIVITNSAGEEISGNAKIKKPRIEGVAGIYINKTLRSFRDFNESVYHPEQGYWVPDYTKPTYGYWDPGYIRDIEFNYKGNDAQGPADGNFANSDNYYQPSDGDDYTQPANDPNPITKFLSSYTTPSWTATPPLNANATQGWKWVYSTFVATSWREKWNKTVDAWTEREVDVTINSQDSLGGKIVLKLQMNIPVPKTAGTPSVTTNYYFKQIDLATFKNNFKIYSASGSLVSSNDVVEIGIEKVEFKKEALPANTDFVKIEGNNVIYITLDQKYKNDGKQKYFSIGEGFIHEDGITTFSNKAFWDDKGFAKYPIVDPAF